MNTHTNAHSSRPGRTWVSSGMVVAADPGRSLEERARALGYRVRGMTDTGTGPAPGGGIVFFPEDPNSIRCCIGFPNEVAAVRWLDSRGWEQ